MTYAHGNVIIPIGDTYFFDFSRLHRIQGISIEYAPVLGNACETNAFSMCDDAWHIDFALTSTNILLVLLMLVVFFFHLLRSVCSLCIRAMHVAMQSYGNAYFTAVIRATSILLHRNTDFTPTHT